MKKTLSIVGGVLSAAAVIYALVHIIIALKVAKEIYPICDEDMKE